MLCGMAPVRVIALGGSTAVLGKGAMALLLACPKLAAAHTATHRYGVRHRLW